MPAEPASDTMVDVAAGLIFREGKLLIAQRHPESHLGGLWEFPGGKREAGETFEAALIRELREELDTTVSILGWVETVEHTYRERRVRIVFYKCRIQSGEPRALDCHDLKWVDRRQLRDHVFPEADAHLLDRLVAEQQFWT